MKMTLVFAVPSRVAQALIRVHREASFRVRGGSRLEVSAVDDRLKSQTSTATPAEPGELPISLVIASWRCAARCFSGFDFGFEIGEKL
jgi:hypothetical protein